LLAFLAVSSHLLQKFTTFLLPKFFRFSKNPKSNYDFFATYFEISDSDLNKINYLISK